MLGLRAGNFGKPHSFFKQMHYLRKASITRGLDLSLQGRKSRGTRDRNDIRWPPVTEGLLIYYEFLFLTGVLACDHRLSRSPAAS